MKQNSAVANHFDFFESPNKATRILTPLEKRLAAKAAHMKSAKWKKLRKAKLDQARGQCEKCGSWIGRKDVHHKTYDRLGNERLGDLIVLCTHCHEIEDERRAVAAKQRAANALENAIWDSGLSTFATKKYGEDWSGTYDYYDVAEEYAEWLEGCY